MVDAPHLLFCAQLPDCCSQTRSVGEAAARSERAAAHRAGRGSTATSGRQAVSVAASEPYERDREAGWRFATTKAVC